MGCLRGVTLTAMPDLPTFGDAKNDATDAVKRHGRTLIPWLPDPMDCPECGALMYASETFDSRQAAYVASWECRAGGCDAGDRYRDPEYGEEFVAPPREGSGIIREWMRGE